MSNAQRLVASTLGMLGSVGIVLGFGRALSMWPVSSNGFFTLKVSTGVGMGLVILLGCIVFGGILATLYFTGEAWYALGKMNGR